MTLEEAKVWVEHIMERRYEWVSLVGSFFGVKTPSQANRSGNGAKSCKTAAACSICGKACVDRLVAKGA